MSTVDYMLITNDIDRLIKRFQVFPKSFDNNVWECYTKCKQIIFSMQKTGVISHDCVLYDKYIDYITEKLEI